MKCIKCSKETKNENELCDKCAAKQKLKDSKKEFIQAKKDFKRAKFEQINENSAALYGKPVETTGLRSSIICIASAAAAILFSLFIIPGFIFGALAFVEGIIALVDVIRNNRRGHRRIVPLALAILGLIGSVIAVIISILSAVSVIIFLIFGNIVGILSIFVTIIGAIF